MPFHLLHDCFAPPRPGSFVFAVVIYLAGLGGAPAVPTNDQVLQAASVAGSHLSLTADLAGATREAFELEDLRLLGTTAWWTWIAPESGVYAWDSTASAKPVAVSVLMLDALSQWRVVGETYLRPIPGAGMFGNPSIRPDPKGSFVAEGGHSYWIRLDGVRTGDSFFPFPLDPAEPYPVAVQLQRLAGLPPVNDDFARRAVLTLAAPVFGGTLELATLESDETPSHPSGIGRTLWWEWTATERGTARVRFTDTNTPPLLVVYRRAPWQRLEALATSATEFGNVCVRFAHARSALEFDTEAGETYFLQVDALPDFDLAAPFRGGFSFVPAPANDALSTPTELSGLDWSMVANNEGATGSAGDPAVPGSRGSSSVWYRWSTPTGGLLQVSINEPTVFAEPDVEILPPGSTTSTGGFTTWNPGSCPGAFEDLHPLPDFMPVIALFRRFGSSGDRPLLEYQIHGTNEVWGETRAAETWVRMDGPEGVTGSARLYGHLTPPPRNDRRSEAIVLPSAAVRVTGRSAGATTEADERLAADSLPGSGGSAIPRRTVWWRWTSPSTGPWALRALAGRGENVFAIYRSDYDSTTNPQPIGWTRDTPAVFPALAGEAFQIGVMGDSGLGGNVEFRLTPALVPPLQPPRLEYDSTGRLRWLFELPRDWDLPFAGETSTDLRQWEPLAVEWLPGSGAFRLVVDSRPGAHFVRLRFGTP